MKLLENIGETLHDASAGNSPWDKTPKQQRTKHQKAWAKYLQATYSKKIDIHNVSVFKNSRFSFEIFP